MAITAAALAFPALADDFEPEILTVKEKIADGPNARVIDFDVNGSSNVFVLDADTPAMKGNIGTGAAANMVMNKAGDTRYTAGIYMERYLRGPAHAVLEAWDLDTLNPKNEIELPKGKLAQAKSQPTILQVSPDESLMLVQNATPAQSVSIIDLESGEALSEIPRRTTGQSTPPPVLRRRFCPVPAEPRLASR